MSTPPPYQQPSYEVTRHGAGGSTQSPVTYGDGPVAADATQPHYRWRLVAAAITLVVAGVTAALGGFDQVVPLPPDPMPVAVGEQYNGGPWLVTVESAQIGYNLRDPNAFGDERTLVLQVNARVEIIDNRTRFIYGVVRLDEETTLALLGEPTDDVLSHEEQAEPTGLRSLRDNSLVGRLQPGLPVRVAFLWELPAGAAVPDEVTVLVHTLYRRYQIVSFIGDTIEHDEDIPQAAVTVPVLDRTAMT